PAAAPIRPASNTSNTSRPSGSGARPGKAGRTAASPPAGWRAARSLSIWLSRLMRLPRQPVPYQTQQQAGSGQPAGQPPPPAAPESRLPGALGIGNGPLHVSRADLRRARTIGGEQRLVAENIDQPRHAARRRIQGGQRPGAEQRGPALAGDAQAMLDVALTGLAIQWRQRVGEGDALLELAQRSL